MNNVQYICGYARKFERKIKVRGGKRIRKPIKSFDWKAEAQKCGSMFWGFKPFTEDDPRLLEPRAISLVNFAFNSEQHPAGKLQSYSKYIMGENALRQWVVFDIQENGSTERLVCETTYEPPQASFCWMELYHGLEQSKFSTMRTWAMLYWPVRRPLPTPSQVVEGEGVDVEEWNPYIHWDETLEIDEFVSETLERAHDESIIEHSICVVIDGKQRWIPGQQVLDMGKYYGKIVLRLK